MSELVLERAPLSAADREAAPAAAGAGFGIRLVARIIDFGLHSVVAWFGYAVLWIIVYAADTLITRGASVLVMRLDMPSFTEWLVGAMGYAAYHAIMERWYGASLGKLITGLVVLSEDGTRPALWQTWWRSMAVYLDQWLFGLPALASMHPPANQRCGDRWARTIVVRRRDVPASLRQPWANFVVSLTAGVSVDITLVMIGYLFRLL